MSKFYDRVRESVDSFTDEGLRVLVHMIDCMDRETYVFSGTYKDISDKTGVESFSIASWMRVYEDAGIISRLGTETRWYIEENPFEDEDELHWIRSSIA